MLLFSPLCATKGFSTLTSLAYCHSQTTCKVVRYCRDKRTNVVSKSSQAQLAFRFTLRHGLLSMWFLNDILRELHTFWARGGAKFRVSKDFISIPLLSKEMPGPGENIPEISTTEFVKRPVDPRRPAGVRRALLPKLR